MANKRLFIIVTRGLIVHAGHDINFIYGCRKHLEGFNMIEVLGYEDAKTLEIQQIKLDLFGEKFDSKLRKEYRNRGIRFKVARLNRILTPNSVVKLCNGELCKIGKIVSKTHVCYPIYGSYCKDGSEIVWTREGHYHNCRIKDYKDINEILYVYDEVPSA